LKAGEKMWGALKLPNRKIALAIRDLKIGAFKGNWLPILPISIESFTKLSNRDALSISSKKNFSRFSFPKLFCSKVRFYSYIERAGS